MTVSRLSGTNLVAHPRGTGGLIVLAEARCGGMYPSAKADERWCGRGERSIWVQEQATLVQFTCPVLTIFHQSSVEQSEGVTE